MSFLIAAGLLLLAALGLLAWPLLRRARRSAPDDLHRRLVAELDDDVAAGVLPAEDRTLAAADLEPLSVERIPPPRRSGRWPWLVLALVPVVAVVLYWQVGDWRAGIQGDRSAVLHEADQMLAELRAHLRSDPADEAGWITLGHAESAMGNYAAAVTAYGRAVRLDRRRDPELLAAWGEAQVLADPEHLSDRERGIFTAVLKADPDNIRGLWYAGLLALADGDKAGAIAHWQILLQQKIPAPMAEFVRSRLTQLGAAATVPVPAIAADGPTLKLTVRLAPQLAVQHKPDETLFVFVRSPQGGPPFAVRRVAAAQFPMTITLNDGDAMLAGHDLSHADGEVEVVARLSRSGDAQAAPGDLVGTCRLALAAGDHAFTLTIDRHAGSSGD